MKRLFRRTLPVACIIAGLVFAAPATWIRLNPSPQIVLGVVPLDAEIPQLSDEIPPPLPFGTDRVGGVPRFSSPSTRGLWPPDGSPPGPAKWFVDTVDDSGGLRFVAVIGSDARSGDPTTARADSIHVLALDPKSRRGTIIGIPRDSWVNVPGYGNKKITQSLALGGPSLTVRTLREVTGLPITYYIVTGFQGFRSVVAALGGIDAYVPYGMGDAASGAFFQKGWHKMTGTKALAFSRNRHIPAGDLARSENQGRLMIDTLKKLRAETSTKAQVQSWLHILVSRTRVNMGLSELIQLGVLARVTAASDVRNIVAPGRTGSAGAASVVYLTDSAKALFKDVRSDAWADGSYQSFGPPHPSDQSAEPKPSPSTSPSATPEPSTTPTL